MENKRTFNSLPTYGELADKVYPNRIKAKERIMKRTDLKEISDNEFVAVLGMMRLESFLDGWERYELNEQVDENKDYSPKADKEGIYDVIGWEKYKIDFVVVPNIQEEFVEFDPEDSGWINYLASFEIKDIELFDLEENQINLNAEQRLKMATIIQERLTVKN